MTSLSDTLVILLLASKIWRRFQSCTFFRVVFFEIQYCVKIVFRFKTVIRIRSVSGFGDVSLKLLKLFLN